MFIIQTNTDFCCLFKILFFLYRDLIKELSVSIQGKQKERTDILINTIGKALGQIQNHRIPFLVQTSCAVRLFIEVVKFSSVVKLVKFSSVVKLVKFSSVVKFS